MPEKEIIVNNFKIRYSERQKTDGAVFVFLHGWGGNYKSLSPIYRDLDNYVAFDFPGFGGSSDLKEPLSLSDYAKLTMALIKTRLSGRDIIFVAHSFGGRVLLKMLNENKPENVKRIICIGVPFLRGYDYKRKIIAVITKIFKIVFSALPRFLSDGARKIWYKAIGAGDYAALENATIKKTFQNIINEDIFGIARVLENYKTDFIWGSDDKEASLRGAKIISEKVKATLHIIENGGHYPFIGKTAGKFKEIFEQIVKK